MVYDGVYFEVSVRLGKVYLLSRCLGVGSVIISIQVVLMFYKVLLQSYVNVYFKFGWFRYR